MLVMIYAEVNHLLSRDELKWYGEKRERERAKSMFGENTIIRTVKMKHNNSYSKIEETKNKHQFFYSTGKQLIMYFPSKSNNLFFSIVLISLFFGT